MAHNNDQAGSPRSVLEPAVHDVDVADESSVVYLLAFCVARLLAGFEIEHGPWARASSPRTHLELLLRLHIVSFCRALALLQGKRTARPGFADAYGGNFSCHRVQQEDLDFAWERVYYTAPAYNFFQFGAELFPDWKLATEKMRACDMAHYLGKLQKFPLVEQVTRIRKVGVDAMDEDGRVLDQSPSWVQRVLLKPYKNCSEGFARKFGGRTALSSYRRFHCFGQSGHAAQARAL